MDAAPGHGLPSLLGRNRAHGSALALAREREALVALFGDLGAFPAIAADAFRAEIRQEAARLAFDVGAHVSRASYRRRRSYNSKVQEGDSHECNDSWVFSLNSLKACPHHQIEVDN